MSEDTLLRDRVVAAIGDRYTIDRELGRGALSVVYLGRDVRLDRPVAIKVLPPDAAFRAEVRARFLREAQTAARLAHPHVVPIYSVDDTGGIACIVMAYVEGDTLGQRLARTARLPVADTVRILRDVADALGYAHAQGVVHRDIKPDNILLDAGHGRVLVTDFGIARAMEGSDQVTVTGVAVGTPAYMSPEQAMGDRALDGRSDIYALGIVAWQMLAGALPFQASSTPAMLLKHVGEPLPSLAARRPDAPAALVAVIERALAKKPEDRWPGAREFRDALSAALDAPPAPREVAVQPPPPARVQAPVAAPALDALPRFPQYPVGGGRAEREAWREATRAWREQVRNRAAMVAYNPRAEMVPAPALAWRDDDPAAIAWRIRRFRSGVWTYAAVMPGLLVVNAFGGGFPWVVFPALFWGMSLARQAGRLRARGVGAMEALLGDRGAARASLDAEVVAGGEAGVARRVARFRTAAIGTGISLGIAAISAGIGSTFEINAMIAPFVAGLVAAGLGALMTMRRAVDVKALRLPLLDALRGKWREAFRRENPVLASKVLDAEAQKKLPADVLGGPYGDALRRAAEDRATILDTVAKLGASDASLIPDVLPTVQHLEERIVSVATALHRMRDDVSPEQLADTERRLAAATAAGATAGSSDERGRTATLLARQVETLRDLVGRKAALAEQLESATLLLTTLKLDLLRLRSAGVDSNLAEATGATQEARALSRDISVALEVAGELRKL
jgi:predicted Ser/Thr protein kinase